MYVHLAPRQKLGYLLLAAMLLFAVGYVGAQRLKRPPPITMEAAGETDEVKILVHVAGAVKDPGVYTFTSSEARVQDAVDSAGGAVEGANLDMLNLAARLVDGSKIVVPTDDPALTGPLTLNIEPSWGYGAIRKPPAKGGKSTRSTSISSKSAPKRETAVAKRDTTPSIVSLNSASFAQLQSLPGVGPSTAKKIIDYRNERGGFTNVEELTEVQGIGDAKFEKMRPYLSL